MNYVHIVAVDNVNAIGNGGTIPWRSPTDLSHFKETTMGHVLIMGRKTYDSLPPAKLPGRVLIVVTRSPVLQNNVVQHAHVVAGLKAAFVKAEQLARKNGQMNVFIVGGGEIYASTADKINQLILSRIDTYAQHADTYYPATIADKMKLVNKNKLETKPNEPSVTVYHYQK